MLFSYAKTIVSERRAHQTTMKIAEKVSRSHQKTVEEQEQESIQKGTAFEPVLDAILQEFWPPKTIQKVSKKQVKKRLKKKTILDPWF